MTTPPITELTTRARDVFRLVVDAYLETGQPVGSRTLSKLATLNLSPASIRNVMQDLEEFGLLASPHTSAGRLPTEQGLRLFVDGMMQVAEPSAEDRAQIEASLSDAGPIESALAQATAPFFQFDAEGSEVIHRDQVADLDLPEILDLRSGGEGQLVAAAALDRQFALVLVDGGDDSL